MPTVYPGTQLFINNGRSTLAAGISNSDTPVATITLVTGGGLLFPLVNPSSLIYTESFALATLTNTDGSLHEVVRITTNTQNDTIVVERAQEDTIALSWPSGTVIYAALTAGSLDILGVRCWNNYNTAGGYQTLLSDLGTIGCNTAFGYQSMYNLIGSKSTAFGCESLYSQTTGVGNLAIGYRALYDSDNTNYNVGVGNETLPLVNGSYNTAMGHKAGTGGSGSYSGDQCSWFGALSGPAEGSNPVNSTAIGYGAQVTDSNSIQLGNTSVTSLRFGSGYDVLHTGIVPQPMSLDVQVYTTSQSPGAIAFPCASHQVMLMDASSGNLTVTLPFPISVFQFTIKKIDSSANTVTVTSSYGIDAGTSVVLSTQWEDVSVVAGGATSNKYYTLSTMDGGTGSNATINVLFDATPSAISAGTSTYSQMGYSATITGYTILADVSGSISVDVQKSTYASYPTFSSIVAGNPIVISAAQKAQDLTLTGWNNSISAGDILQFVVNSSSTIKKATITLFLLKL